MNKDYKNDVFPRQGHNHNIQYKHQIRTKDDFELLDEDSDI